VRRGAGASLLAASLALGLSACGSTTSSSSFKGEDSAVAQAITNMQSDATAGSYQKVCANDLAGAVQARLKASGDDCQKALKSQLSEIDNFELTVKSVAVSGDTATARVQSTYSGKVGLGTLSLVKEGSHWKVSGVQAPGAP